MGKRSYREIDEDDEEDRPRRRRRKGGGSRAPLIITLVCLIVGVAGGGGFLIYWLVAVRPKAKLEKNQAKGQEQLENNLLKGRKRLLGSWSGLVREEPRTVMVFEFRAHGGFRISGSRTDLRGTLTEDGTWKVVESKGNTVRVRVVMNGKTYNDMTFEFISANQFQKTHDGRVVTFSRVR